MTQSVGQENAGMKKSQEPAVGMGVPVWHCGAGGKWLSSPAADQAGPLHPSTSWLPFSPRFEAIHHELNKATAQNKDLQWEMELLQSELTELRTMQVKTEKESEKYKEERDAVYSEYKLIMSERDQVISELDKLQTEVELAESKLKSSTCEKKAASEGVEALRQSLQGPQRQGP
ncbi:disks large homolog 5-like [Cynocephalus volans]|uniref:disks large homolog 5-like n=1 Tax=Cynocephalus volans TaxID=110931 RepID=UPI002FCA7CAE